jgi:hypothetical protein
VGGSVAWPAAWNEISTVAGGIAGAFSALEGTTAAARNSRRAELRSFMTYTAGLPPPPAQLKHSAGQNPEVSQTLLPPPPPPLPPLPPVTVMSVQKSPATLQQQLASSGL